MLIYGSCSTQNTLFSFSNQRVQDHITLDNLFVDAKIRSDKASNCYKCLKVIVCTVVHWNRYLLYHRYGFQADRVCCCALCHYARYPIDSPLSHPIG